MLRAALSLLLLSTAAVPTFAQSSFVNWESPHVHPLDATPNGDRLLAVNTADARLEVFRIGQQLRRVVSIPVGLDPVSVRARGNGEAWVVNHVSDSISVVDLASGLVRATLATDDEPCDVVFAGTPQRAFVSCSQANTLLVFDPADLTAAPTRIQVQGEDPRALAVSPDGQEVYLAVFESGNGSTILGGGLQINGLYPPNAVNHPAGPHGGVNPPANGPNGAFVPVLNPALPGMLRVGLIVKKDASGAWRDDTGADWTNLVSGTQSHLSGRPQGWDLPDRDLAIVDAQTLGVTYARSLMNACMAVAVNPASGLVTVVGTDATNEVRYEPVLRGRFLRVLAAFVDPASASTAGTAGVVDLNPHIDYATSGTSQPRRNRSLGDPRAIVWNTAGTRAWVAGMGSNNLVTIGPDGVRIGLARTIEVGEGPTGLVLDEGRGRLYVLNKFGASVSTVELATSREVAQTSFFDPTPAAIRAGRRHLYDTHATSGHGHVSCGSCHVDARMDRLAWDLGDPSGDMAPFAGANILPLGVAALPYHPMKGPMTTQTLQDIIGKEPLHWRGDRNGLEDFNPAFVGLQGDDQMLSAQEMQEFEDFLATIHFPPNPFRELDNTLPTDLPLPGHHATGDFQLAAGAPLPNGDAQNGLQLYTPPTTLDGALACVTCHTLPLGLGPDASFGGGQWNPLAPGANGERHHALVTTDGSTNRLIKVPQLRNVYEKVGFDATQLENTAGFGFLHDGSIDTIARFVGEPLFELTNDQQVADLVALMLAFSGSDFPAASGSFLFPPGTASQDTHAAVGQQVTLVDHQAPGAGQLARIAQLTALAEQGAVGLVARGRIGAVRGFTYVGGGQFQSDRAAQTLGEPQLRILAQPGSELTYTVVPKGSELRLGVDRDEDGFFDRDELDAGSDPDDASSVPGP